jgi:hypothetical protein
MSKCFSPARLAGVALLGLALTLGSARAAGWGTVKGRIVWGGDKMPVPEKIDVSKNRDAAFCQKDGPVFKEEKVVNPKNNGVRWVIVWLADPEAPRKAPAPIHPALMAPKPKTHVLDQPCCAFKPHVLAMRGGDTLVAKNSATITHNTKVEGGLLGPRINPIIPPGKEVAMKDIKARRIPIIVTCSIHPWMKAYVKVFDHPYYAVTDANGNFTIKDAPAGKYRLIAWEESEGYIVGAKDKENEGLLINIKANGTTDLGELKMAPSAE